MQFTGLVRLVLVLAMISLFGQQRIQAQENQPTDRGMSAVTVNGKKISIDYGRPAMKGRDMLAMAPDGYVWRMGKDDDTTFATETDLMFGKILIAKGRYIAETKHVKGDIWVLILGKDEVKTEIPFSYQKGQDHVEIFTIEINNTGDKGSMTVTWGGHKLIAAFMAK